MSFSFFHSFIFLELCFFELITLQFLLSTTLAINFITDYLFRRYPKRWWQDVYWGVLWYPKMAYNFFLPQKFSFLSSKTCEFFIFYTKLIKKNNLCDVIKLIKLEIFFAFWFLAKTIKKLWVSNEHVLTAGILISDWSSRSSCSRYFIFSSRVWYKELRRVYERDENCFNIYKFLRSVHVHTFNKMKSEMTWERQR